MENGSLNTQPFTIYPDFPPALTKRQVIGKLGGQAAWGPEHRDKTLAALREGVRRKMARKKAQEKKATSSKPPAELIPTGCDSSSGDRPAMALAYAFVSGLGMAVGYFVKWLIGC